VSGDGAPVARKNVPVLCITEQHVGAVKHAHADAVLLAGLAFDSLQQIFRLGGGVLGAAEERQGRFFFFTRKSAKFDPL